MLRIPRERLGDFTLKRSGYAFYTRTDPSLLSMLTAAVGAEIGRPQTIPAFFDEQFDVGSGVDNVCGTPSNVMDIGRSERNQHWLGQQSGGGELERAFHGAALPLSDCPCAADVTGSIE